MLQRIASIVVISLLLGACAAPSSPGIETPAPAPATEEEPAIPKEPELTPAPTAEEEPAITKEPEQAPTTEEEPAIPKKPKPAPAPPTKKEPAITKEPEPELFLEILTPKDESIIQTEEITVTGKTLPTAIVSVNGELTLVKEDGEFSSKITLKEGPNLIEAVASDLGGNEIGEILTIIYMLE